MGRDMPLRIPHHTAGPEAMVGEVALAASGILFLDDILEFRTSTLRRTFAVWRQMHPKAQPILVIGLRLSDDQRSAEFEWPRIQRLAEDLPLIKHHLIAD
ncbi:MAG: hypothetical protein A2341_28115 [Deltaproteobacteria bacterium RIFOXYB12_FULL_58_9]|nr:MAG: hypothetical protein A2341_28115 [Deltaproteobacteria bacterium RIFOXYB12_FULL_58_9]